jgi:hypothetical protein
MMMMMNNEQSSNRNAWQEKPKYSEKTCPSAPLSTTSLGLKPNLPRREASEPEQFYPYETTVLPDEYGTLRNI